MSSNPDGAIFRSRNSYRHHPSGLGSQPSHLICWLILFGFYFLNLSGCRSLHSRVSRRSTQCEALCAQARAAREAGNTEKANEYLDEALQQRPSDFETRRRLADTMWNSGRQMEAISQFAALREEFPNDAKLASKLAVMQWESNQRVAASKTAMDALKLDPSSKEAWLIKARAETESEELDDALASYLRMSQVAPDDLTVLLELGELHLKRGHPDRACPLLRTALAHPQATAQQKIETEWLLGVAYAKSDRWSEAIEVLDRLISQRNSTADDWCFLGWTRMHGGDLAGAQSALQHAELAEPDSLAVRRFARQLKSSSPSSHQHRQVSSVNNQN